MNLAIAKFSNFESEGYDMHNMLKITATQVCLLI
jgi:hypothetical protein